MKINMFLLLILLVLFTLNWAFSANRVSFKSLCVFASNDDYDPNEFLFMNEDGEVVKMKPFGENIYEHLDYVIEKLEQRINSKQKLSLSDTERLVKSVNVILADSRYVEKSPHSISVRKPIESRPIDGDGIPFVDEGSGMKFNRPIRDRFTRPDYRFDESIAQSAREMTREEGDELVRKGLKARSLMALVEEEDEDESDDYYGVSKMQRSKSFPSVALWGKGSDNLDDEDITSEMPKKAYGKIQHETKKPVTHGVNYINNMALVDNSSQPSSIPPAPSDSDSWNLRTVITKNSTTT
jgi:hypothetical protein